MKKSYAFAFICMFYTSSALAEEAGFLNSFPGSFTGTLAVLSDYSPRGISLSDRRPALHARLDYNHPEGPYVGAAITNIRLNDGGQGTSETNLYGGIRKRWGEYNVDLGGIGYIYEGVPSYFHYDFFELKAALGKNFDWGTLTGTIYYSPNYFAGTDHTRYKMLSATVPIGQSFSFNASLSHQDIGDNAGLALPDYWHWSAGVTFNLAPYFISANYMDSDLAGSHCGGNARPRLGFNVIRMF